MDSRRIRLISFIFLLILAGLIVWFKVVPNGRITYSKNYPVKVNLFGGKGFIGGFTPADRVKIIKGQAAKISGDPVYFSVFTPRTFSQAKLTITYQEKLNSSTPIIEAGVLVDNIVWRYQLAPIENRILDEQFKDWNRLQQGDVLLLQKDKNFSSVLEFLNALKSEPNNFCPSGELKTCLALYNTDELSADFPKTSAPYKIPNFKTISTPLQGTHQFYFIKSSEQQAAFAFDFTDLNLNKDSDTVTISIYSGAVKIYSKTIVDEQGGESSGAVRNFSDSFFASILDDQPGVYKLEIKANDDVVIKKIKQAPSALNVIGKIHPVANTKAISLWTDSSVIQVTTNNPASEQTIVFGSERFKLSDAYQPFEFTSSLAGLKEIRLVRDDVILATSGTFSLAADDYFNPDFKQINRNFALNDQFKYLLAKYQAPKDLGGGFKQATVILNTQEAYREKGKYSFMISVPGLSLSEGGSVQVSNIKVEFTGRTLWAKLKEKIAVYAN